MAPAAKEQSGANTERKRIFEPSDPAPDKYIMNCGSRASRVSLSSDSCQHQNKLETKELSKLSSPKSFIHMIGALPRDNGYTNDSTESCRLSGDRLFTVGTCGKYLNKYFGVVLLSSPIKEIMN